MSHTPTPWNIDNTDYGAPLIRAKTCWMKGSRDVAKVLYHYGSEDPEVDQNAAFIVRACNAHEELVEALRGMLEWARRVKEINPGPEVAKAVSALRKAQEEVHSER